MRVLLSLASLVVALAAAPLAAQDSGLPIGTKAPALTLRDINGVPVDLRSIIGTRPVLLEFWATWCGNCKELEPTMVAVQREFGRDVAVFAVAVPLNQSLERVKRYVTQAKYPFPMLWDAEGELSGLYEVPATSHVVLIGKDGTVAYTGTGGTQDLAAAIRRLK
jgi:thiol-disulfide isomerase/thioredoxin